MNVITAPDWSFLQKTVFLAGSIENGAAEQWQKRFIAEFPKLLGETQASRLTILNPRRDDWNPKASTHDITYQIEWELEAMQSSDLIVMYFDPATKSPVTMLELGLHALSGKLVVCCPAGFWRVTNVEAVCKRYGVPFTRSWGTFLRTAQDELYPVRGL